MQKWPNFALHPTTLRYMWRVSFVVMAQGGTTQGVIFVRDKESDRKFWALRFLNIEGFI